MATTEYFMARGVDGDLGALVKARSAPDAVIEFHNAGGGFLRRLPEAEFHATFRNVDNDELSRLQAALKPVTATFHDEGGSAMEGWTNGNRWNGWLVPLFTRDSIMAEADGGYLAADGMDGVARFIYRAETDDMLEVSSWSGDNLIGSVDAERILSVLAAGLSPEEIDETFKEMDLIVHVADKSAVFDEHGVPTSVFAVGNGWCWQEAMPLGATPTAPSM